jgi:tRNA (guanine37-N1)-methyltransferase
MLRFEVLSLFPDYFRSPLEESMLRRAREAGLIEVELVNIRDYTLDRHKKTDDRAYGGGPGMVMMVEPIVRAIRAVRRPQTRVIYLSPQGKRLDAKRCRELAKEKHIILLSGHYEGIDERAMKEIDEEISIGDFVMTNGCPAALCLIDAVMRFVPGVIGDERAAGEDSHEAGLFDWPCYTRPEEFEGEKVPEVLLSGNHKEIDAWRRKMAAEKTARVRPDLIAGHEKD